MAKRSRSTRPPGSTAPLAPAPTRTAPVTSPEAAPAAQARRVRQPAAAPRPALERYRGAIIGAVIVAIVAVGGVFVFLGATQPVYACASVLQPEPAATAAADATPRLGQATHDMGRNHVETGSRVTYEYCPPASGPHYNDARYGPIATRFYGPDDQTVPQGWVHNLEHGMTVILYRCPEGCASAAQDALRTLQQQLPASPLCGFPATSTVVVTRFDDLPTPYAAVVWDRVVFLDSLDVAALATFRSQSADRGPEPQCQEAVPGASPSAAPSATLAPSATPAPSAVAAPSATPAP